MIINKIITLNTFGNRRLKHFSDIGYDISGENFDIKVVDLNTGSREIVEVECDFCKKIVNITYKEYLRNISGFINKFACCVKCGSDKAKETNIKNIGVESHTMLDSNKERVKATNLSKYGVEYLQQNDLFKNKSKKTLLSKYGVDHISKSIYFKSKFKETCLKKHGVEYPMQSNVVKEKSKETCFKNYGVDNPSKSEIIRDKVMGTNLSKYGNENYILSSDFSIKSLDKLNKKWYSDNIMKSEIFRKGRYSISKDENYIEYKFSGFSKMTCIEGHEFDIHIDNYIKRIKSNISLCTICNPIGDSKSIKEKDLFNFIKSNYSGEIIQSYRDGLEIDIYLPNLKIGFEFNGLYWHSEQFKEKNYHLNKTNYFKEKGIRIIHIWEDDWTFKREIIKSQIKNLLNISTEKIFARNCVVKELNSVTDFLNNNHIQGVDRSSNKIGLFYNNKLVSIMTFNRLEGRKKLSEGEYNLSRFCNKINTSVIGGASKLLNYFEKNNKVTRLISYVDKDWSVGQLYYTLGFKNISESKPDYKYIIDNKRKHKQNFKKSNLNTELMELDFMKKKEICKIYDCGKIKFEKN